MALPDLATSADLSARGVDISDTALVSTMLAVASSLVREAAGSPIAQHEATVTFWAVDQSQWLPLPVRPVTAVSAVTLDGDTITDHKVVDGSLWRLHGWAGRYEPLEVEVTLTCGLPTVPASVVQLVCDLAIVGMNTATSGAIDPRVVAERIDDYSVTFAGPGELVASAMTVPAATRRNLRARFGGGAGSVRLR